MNKTLSISFKKWSALTLGLCLAFGFLCPASVSAGVCESALGSCVADAIFPGAVLAFFSPVTFAMELGICGMGYNWCVRYYSQ